MKIFITGGTGLLGSALSFELMKRHEIICGDHNNYIEIKGNKISHSKIDICDTNSLKFIEKLSPDVIIHTAALTDLEFCEKNPKIAYDINVIGTKNMLDISKKCNAKFIYFCTDYIFDGKTGNYSETDKTNPTSIYAKTKLHGEELVKNEHEDCVSIRTSLYGWYPNHKKTSFSSWIINSLRKNEKICVISDQISSLIFTNDLAGIVDKIIENDLKGIYNIASRDCASKYDFALNVAKIFNLNDNLIEPITLKSLTEKISLSASRPKNASMNISKIERELSTRMPTIKEGIISMREKEMEFNNNVSLHGY